MYDKNWLKTEKFTVNKNMKPSLKVSIIVSARNEEKNIAKCLNSLINQNYESNDFEIIVIDDFSEDRTVEIVLEFKKVRLLKLNDNLEANYKNIANKKRAISLGVKNSKNEIIITVDADCFYKKDWLNYFAQYYLKHKSKMITAPVAFVSKNTFISDFLELDLISLMGITAATIKDNKPTMVNGANLLFEKKVFLEVEAYKGNENIASGDDVFLMQKIHAKYNSSISFLKSREAIAFTNAPFTFKEFLNQRIRWTSKSVVFADFHVKLSLLLNYLFYFSLFSNLFILSFFSLKFLIFGVLIFLLKYFIDRRFFKSLFLFFNTQNFKTLLLIELLHIVYIFMLGLFSIYGKYSWKGRK